MRFHDLRHSHATQLLLEGVHPKIAQERLGHSTITTTLDFTAMSRTRCKSTLRNGSMRRGGGGDQIRSHIGGVGRII